MSLKEQTKKEMDEMSEPTQQAGEPIKENFVDPATGAKEKFNPNIHATNKNNEPILRKDGFYRRKPGNSKTATPGEKPSSIGVDPGTGLGTPTNEMAVVATAKTVCHLQFMAGIALWGELGKPQPDEEQYLLYAWATYLAEKGVENIPPVVVVLMATSMYALPRFIQHPGSREKVKSVWDKIFPKKREPEPESENPKVVPAAKKVKK